ncbi:hypothetical protein ACFX58_15715 [Sphingomonas sp. NCPPB 2930]
MNKLRDSVSINNLEQAWTRRTTPARDGVGGRHTSTKPAKGSNRRSCSARCNADFDAQQAGSVVLRIDDLPIPLAAAPWSASLCDKKRELLPFVQVLEHWRAPAGKPHRAICCKAFRSGSKPKDAGAVGWSRPVAI